MIDMEEIKKLVIVRLEAMPDSIRVSIGSEGKKLSKEDLIKHVKDKDKLGEMIVEMQLKYLKAMKTGF